MTEENEKEFADFMTKVMSCDQLSDEDKYELEFERMRQTGNAKKIMDAIEAMLYQLLWTHNNMSRPDVSKTVHEHMAGVKMMTVVYSHSSGVNISITIPQDVVVRRAMVDEGVSVTYQYTEKYVFRRMDGEGLRCPVGVVMKGRMRAIFPEAEARDEKQALDDMVSLAAFVDTPLMSLMADIVKPVATFFTYPRRHVSHFRQVATQPFYAMQLTIRNAKTDLLRIRIT